MLWSKISTAVPSAQKLLTKHSSRTGDWKADTARGGRGARPVTLADGRARLLVGGLSPSVRPLTSPTPWRGPSGQARRDGRPRPGQGAHGECRRHGQARGRAVLLLPAPPPPAEGHERQRQRPHQGALPEGDGLLQGDGGEGPPGLCPDQRQVQEGARQQDGQRGVPRGAVALSLTIRRR